MIAHHNLEEVRKQGFSIIEKLIPQTELDQFEQSIAILASALAPEDLDRTAHPDPFLSLFPMDEEDRALLFTLMERHFNLHRISANLGEDLRTGGFFNWTGMKVPLVWPDLRIDLPFCSRGLLPVHQDYKSTRCRRAFRLWIPLRRADEEHGTMCLYSGTHRFGPTLHDLNDPAHPTIDPRHYAGAERIVFDLPAGDGVLIDPLVFHASVPNRSSLTKFTLMIQIQDLASLIRSDDQEIANFAVAREVRARAEALSEQERKQRQAN